MIDETQILNLIGVQIQTIIDNNQTDYEGYKFSITNEIMYVKDKQRLEALKNNPKQIFIVIKFLPATINYGQVLMPVLINAIGEKNKLEKCYHLLMEYAETYNLEFNVDKTIKQYYQSPTVLSNFNEIGDGFRSLISLSGTFQISENSNDFDLYFKYTVDEQEVSYLVPAISLNGSFDIQLESQAFYDVSERTTSTGKVGTFVINCTCYLDDTELVNECLKIATKQSSVNTTFNFDLVFKNGLSLEDETFKMANFTFEKSIGNLPVCTITFTN
jgi:hypothetical protein